MNIGSKLLAAGLLVGVVGCSTEETVYVDNMDKNAKDALATAVRHAGFELADVKVTKLELDRDPASAVYEVEFEKGWHEEGASLRESRRLCYNQDCNDYNSVREA